MIIFLISAKFYSEKVYIHKPKISRLSNSEKYIVCIGYKGNNIDILNILIHSFQTKDLDIKIDSNFDKELEKYNKLYTDIQMNQIKKGIQLINEKKIINYPNKIQKKCAIEWCQKYNIRINFLCYYLDRTFSN